MKRYLLSCLLLVFIGCRQDPTAIAPRGSCGSPCSTSTDCSNFFGGCRVCFGGKCVSSLPATPTPIDAGVDATPANP